MLSRAKMMVQSQENRLQDGIGEVKKRIVLAKENVQKKYKKAQYTGTKSVFDAAVQTETKIIVLLEHPKAPKTPLHPPIKARIERFNEPKIENYDALNVKTIVKELKGMNTWNLLKIDRREKNQKNRKTVFRAIEKEHKRNMTI